ncbi:retrovirus-related pol polyprotein from transposon TNT 1-94 [Tanacetum coccineum]
MGRSTRWKGTGCGVYKFGGKLVGGDVQYFKTRGEGNPQQALKYKGMFDSGCSRHMTGNKALLTDYHDIDGGFVAFGGSTRGGKITEFIPSGDLTCLFVKATIDESKLWHRRLGYVNFKTMNILVKGNLVRGLPSKTFENDHTCVACQKGKSDNETEFKNREKDEFCREKWIKREYSVARTPQQNRVAERKNMTLIEAARTMLADSLLPTVFWAEAVNTACYVLNRVLVTKPHNKTPYELIIGRPPSISFMRPFGCHVTILNTLDPLGKFDGKAKEGFLVGYSVNRKAFKVFNSQTRKVEENLHVNFIENKPNVAGQGPNWLFDIDSLTNSMNYQPVTTGNQTNKNAGPQKANGDIGLKKSVDARQSEEKNVSTQQYIMFLLWSSISSSYKSLDETYKNDTADDAAVNTTDGSRIFGDAGSSFVPLSKFNNFPHDPLIPDLEDTAKVQNTSVFGSAFDDEDLDTYNSPFANQVMCAEANFNNMEPSIIVSPIPTTRVHSIHPKDQIIGDPKSVVQTRGMTKKSSGEHAMINYIQKQRSENDYEHDRYERIPNEGKSIPTNVLIAAVEAAENILPVAAHEEVETIHNMTAENKLYFQAEKEAIFLILTGIGDEIYSTVDACNTAKEMWTAIERLQQGESLNVQDVKTNLFWEFGKFTSRDGESMESYYSRFYKLMNELTRNNLQVSPMQVNVQFLQQLQPEWSRFVTVVKQGQEIDTVSYHKLFDVLKQFQNEVNDIRSERLARSANPLALLAAAQPNSDNYYEAPVPQRSNAPSYKQSSSTRSTATTRHKGKEIAKPVTPQSESVSEEDSDPEQARRDKDMQKNLALLAKYFKKLYKPTNNNLRTSSNSTNKTEDTTPRYNNDNQSRQFGNQRTVTVAGARETVGSPVVQKTGIQCFNCKGFGHYARECRKPKRVKDYAYHKEKMMMCKQAEQGVPLQAEQADWLEDTDEEIDEQELEAHYSYMAKIQEVSPAESSSTDTPLEQVQNHDENDVFANVRRHSEQPESINDTYVLEKDDSNVIPDSSNICTNDNQVDQNAAECVDERAALANLIANLTLDTEENKTVLKQLKKANASLTHLNN